MKSKFLAGDFPNGTEMIDAFGYYILEIPGEGKIDLNRHIVALETVTEQNKQKVFGKIGWGLVGGMAFGPIGLLAGLIVGGKSKEVCIVCQLVDGRSFMASVSGQVHQK